MLAAAPATIPFTNVLLSGTSRPSRAHHSGDAQFTTEAQRTQRLHREIPGCYSLWSLCVLCASVVIYDDCQGMRFGIPAIAAVLSAVLTGCGNPAPQTRRAAAQTPVERTPAATGLENALSRLMLVVENYPQLKSNQNFLALQSQLEGTENRIAVERRRFNESVREYNTRLRLFPGSLVASFAGYRPKAFFEAAPEAAQPPKVKF